MSKRDEAPMGLQDSNRETTDHPAVFISYSHDSSAHKIWVSELAGRLMENGVDVILDQWDLEPGDDVPKFMEQSVRRANKVLMICTEAYVRKADDGKGGVGYESMIVTGELVQDLGTSKFIPVIRQAEGQTAKPASVSTRLHIDLSEGQDIEEQFTSLLKAIHGVVRSARPPLGVNPFSDTSPAVPLRRDQPAPLSSQLDVVEALDQRVGLVVGELDLGPTHPTYILAAIPSHKVQIQSLFTSKDAAVVKLLENPPQIRPSGFDLDVGGRAARIVPGGNRRRALEVKYKALNLWEDGTLIFSADAQDFVCWRPIHEEGVPLRIQPLALIETVLLFCQLSKDIFDQANPKPGDVSYEVHYVLELRNTRVGEVNCGLIPGPVGSVAWKFGINIHRATESKLRVNILWQSKDIDPGRIAYRLLASLYEQFGTDHDAIPYREKAGSDFIISAEEIRRLHAW